MIKKIISNNKDFLPRSQITEVYNLIRDNIYRADWVTEPLHCLNTLISEGLIKPQLYEVIDEVFSSMIKTYNQNIRDLSRNVIFNFIQNAPMSETILDKFILKLVNNLDFEDHSGRETVVEILQVVVDRFPMSSYQKNLDMIVMGLVTALANENIFAVKHKMKMVVSSLLTKLSDSEEHKGTISTYKDFTASFLEQDDINTKRAGVLLLECFLMLENSKIDKLLMKGLKQCIGTIMNEEKNVRQFYDELKEEKELKELVSNSAWKNVALKQEGAREVFQTVKNNKEMIVDCLIIISTFTKQSPRKSIIELYDDAVLAAIGVRNHPDDDIQKLVFDLMVMWSTFPYMRDFILKDVKGLLMITFGAIKSQSFTPKNYLGKVEHILKLAYFDVGKISPDMKVNFLQSMDVIAAKKLKFFKEDNTSFTKLIGTIEIIVKYSKMIKIKIDGEELQIMLKLILRLKLNGNFQKLKQLYDLLEIVSGLISKIEYISNGDNRCSET